MIELDISKSHVIHQWKTESPLLACRFSPTGLHCVSTTQDFQLQRWTIANGEKVPLIGHESWVHALTFSPTGDLLVSGGCEGRLIWWSIAEAGPKIIRSVEAHQGWIRGVERSADGKLLVSVGNDRTIKLWDMQTGQNLASWPAHERHIYSAAFHPDGQHLVTADLMGKIHAWKLDDRSLVRTFDGSTLYSPNKGQNPFGAVHEPLLLRFQWGDGALSKSHVCDGIPGGLLYRVCAINDSTVGAVSGGSSGGILLFFNSSQEKEIHRAGLPSLARDMDVHVGSGLVATAHYDQHLRISGLFA